MCAYVYVCMCVHGATGHRECVASLLGCGADINAKDKKQYTPLHCAAAGGQAITVKLLVELGADVSHTRMYMQTTCMHNVSCMYCMVCH